MEEAYSGLASFVPTYHEHRALGVPDHRLRNAAYQGPFQGAKTSATDHDRPCAQLLARLHDLLVWISCPEVSLCYLPSRWPDLLGLFFEERAGRRFDNTKTPGPPRLGFWAQLDKSGAKVESVRVHVR